MPSIKKYLPLYMILLGVVSWFVINFFFGERVPVNNNFGWDGAIYADITGHFYKFVHDKLLDAYRVKRIFPSLMVFLAANITSISLEVPAHIVKGFYLFNVLCLIFAAYGFYLIAKLQQWRLATVIIGFSGLFLNYGILKMTSYYPILTDDAAFALGVWMVYFYLLDSSLGLALVTLIGAFTFPSMLLCGFILMVLPRNSIGRQAPERAIALSVNNPLNASIVSFIIAIGFCWMAMHMIGTTHPSEFTSRYREIMDIHFLPALHSTLIGVASLLGVFFYIYFAAKPFIKKQIVLSISYLRYPLAIMLAAFILFIQHKLGNPALPAFSGSAYIRVVFSGSLSNPLLFLVANFVYYGPIVLLAVIFWKELVSVSYQTGMGLTLLLALYTMMAVVPESRQCFNALAIFVFLVCEVMNRKNISISFAYCFVVLSIIVSKFWLPINAFSWGYGMSQGPGMDEKTYLAQLIAMIASFLIISRLMKNFQRIEVI